MAQRKAGKEIGTSRSRTKDRVTAEKIAFVVTLTAAPSLISDPLIRIILTLATTCLAGLIIWSLMKKELAASREKRNTMIKKQCAEFETAMEPALKLLQERGQIIPVLVGQLQEVVEQTEMAALDIGERFMNIVERAQSQASKASDTVTRFAGSGEGSDALIGQSKEALAEVMSTLRDLVETDEAALRDMQTIMHETSDIKTTVNEIEYIADQTNLLALNAAIEAARAGEHGHGFAVVADEVRKLSDRSNTAAEKVRKMIAKIEADMRDILIRTEKTTSESAVRVGESEGAAKDTLKKLDALMSEAKSSMDELTSETGSLANDISTIVISMQFQDITRQRIEHVITPLLTLKTDFETVGKQTRDISIKAHEQGNGNNNEDTSWLEGMYTMEAERKVMKNILKGNFS